MEKERLQGKFSRFYLMRSGKFFITLPFNPYAGTLIMLQDGSAF